MLFQGKAIECFMEDGNIAQMKFDLQGESVNKFNALTLKELSECLEILRNTKDVKGLLMTSGKDSFIAGADITEFLEHFKKTSAEMEEWIRGTNVVFSGFEDLDIPSVVAINGFALGGGLEICLTSSYRLGSTKASLGLLETKLGIIPGWGGTVRLSRICGADNAIEWIASGKQYSAEDSFKIGVLDGVVEPEKLLDGARDLLKRAIAGELDWRAKQEEKRKPLLLSQTESAMVFETAKGYISGVAGPNYPAPIKAINVIQKGSTLNRDEALTIENKAFVELAKSAVAESLVHVFMGGQSLKKISKGHAKKSREINKAAVLGAGIMGGGISYQSASKGTPTIMKDINQKALEIGMGEATKLLSKLIDRGKIDNKKMAHIISQIKPTLNYDSDFKDTSIVVEAVFENEKVKKSVLAELEEVVNENTILATNTSTLSVTKLGEDLKRPQNFCGMHFFNPVPKMPLVEVIRGEKSNDEAIATTVSYAVKMGKTPIVVNDCPGFLVNRVLFPYFAGFSRLVNDGVDFQRIDKIMEKFGWPMGPAYLMDVVGIDIGNHATKIIEEAYPRMKIEEKTALDVMFENQRLGQKNGLGFYEYTKDKKGRPKKQVNEKVYEMFTPLCKNKVEVSDEEIIDRMMFPMIFECIRCLEVMLPAIKGCFRQSSPGRVLTFFPFRYSL